MRIFIPVSDVCKQTRQTAEEEAATRLPKFEHKSPCTPPLSPRGQDGVLLGFDLSLFSAWSGLTNSLTCGVPEAELQVLR